MKQLAKTFLHPEAPIEVDTASMARSYFDRYSAPQQQSLDMMEYIKMVLEDASNLKLNADYYAHPEIGIISYNTIAGARCYFDRYSANDVEYVEESEERAHILDDAMKLKQAARWYLHPEDKVETRDGCAYGRCYFDRYSAVEQEYVEESEERAHILDDAMKLKQAARWYLHPEDKVETRDGCAYGRCYFDRYSAVEQESLEDVKERNLVISDAIALKQLAMDYMHPEVRIVTSDLALCARCYFDRISAVNQESFYNAVEDHKVHLNVTKLKIISGKISVARSGKKKIATKAPDLDDASSKQLYQTSASDVQLYGLDDDFIDVSNNF